MNYLRLVVKMLNLLGKLLYYLLFIVKINFSFFSSFDCLMDSDCYFKYCSLRYFVVNESDASLGVVKSDG